MLAVRLRMSMLEYSAYSYYCLWCVCIRRALRSSMRSTTCSRCAALARNVLYNVLCDSCF